MLSRWTDLRMDQIKQWITHAHACLESSDSDDTELVVRSLGSTTDKYANAQQHVKSIVQKYSLQAREAFADASSEGVAYAEGSRAASAKKAFLELLVPLLRVAVHPGLRSSPLMSHTNPFYSMLMTAIDWGLLAAAVKELKAWLPAAAAPPVPAVAAPGAGSSSGTDGAAVMQVTSCMDVAEPVVYLLHVVLERFQGESEFSRVKAAATDIVTALGNVVPDGQASGARFRRFKHCMAAVESQLGLGRARQGMLDAAQQAAAERRRAQRAAAAGEPADVRVERREADPDHKPGALRPGGPRHSNDHLNFRDIRIVPTAEELLCPVAPYLPSNRPGRIPSHLTGRPVEAHLDCHFRLMRHDVIACLGESLCKLREAGGIAALQAGNRRRMSDLQLVAFRSVELAHVDSTREEGLCYWLSFDAPATLANKSYADKRQAWMRSSRLAHGTLVALWWEPEGAEGGPQVALGVVAQRDVDKLVPKDTAEKPMIGIRLLAKDVRSVLGACLSRAHRAGAAGSSGSTSGNRQQQQQTYFEMVMVQEVGNSFFAYQPILKALQSMRTVPLAHVIIPGERPVGPAGRARLVEPPAYLADGARFDLTCLVDREKAVAMPPEQLNRALTRLSRVDMCDPGSFPLQDLLAVTSLDTGQAGALRAMLMQEVAVVQGPPGTGKTYLGVQLIRALIANTRNTVHEAHRDMAPPPPVVRRLREGAHGQDDTWEVVPAAPAAAAAASGGVEGILRMAAGANAGLDGRAIGVRPHVGPILIVCFTNHALDACLEAVLDAGITDNIIRVGGNSKSERMKRYNLRNASDRASGFNIAQLLKKRDELKEKAKELKTSLVEATHSRVAWVHPLTLILQLTHSRLCTSFAAGLRPWNRRQLQGEEDRDEDGFVQAKSKKSKRAVDLLDDWVKSHPAQDFFNHRISDATLRAIGLDPDASSDDEPAAHLQQQAAAPGGSVRDVVRTAWAQRMPPGSSPAAAAAAGGAAGVASAPGGLLPLMPQRQWQPPQPLQQGQQRKRHAPDAVCALDSQNRPLDQLLDCDDVWAMSRSERQVLYDHLFTLSQEPVLDEVEALDEQVANLNKKVKEEYERAESSALQRARIVGITTSGLARLQQLIASIAPKIVLVEEAAEVFEAHVLTSLAPSTEHLILIGDHEQLRPKAAVYDMQAFSNRGYDLDVSMFERLVRDSDFPLTQLDTQRRMRPEISDLIRAPLYPHLLDHERVRAYPGVRGMVQPLFFVDHDHKEGGAGDENRSKFNDWEAAYAVALAKYLMQQGYRPDEVVILCPYVGQLFALQRKLRESNMRVLLSDRDEADLNNAIGGGDALDDEETAGKSAAAPGTTKRGAPKGMPSVTAPKGAKGKRSSSDGADSQQQQLPANVQVVNVHEQLRVATVDNFQGEEAKVIILSTVRNNKDGTIGFLKMRNRINVMLSRAQHGMYVLGNRSTLLANTERAPMWPSVMGSLEAQGRCGHALPVCCQRHGTVNMIGEVDDFSRLVGDGGCALACGMKLDCGHMCPRRCHVDDPDHHMVRCHQPCDRLHQPCGHPCSKLCYQECGKCIKVLTEPFELPCKHFMSGVPCWKRYTEGELRCPHPVDVTLPGCGHTTSVPCHSAASFLADPTKCKHMVDLAMPTCGHVIQVECGQREGFLSDPTRCTAPCGKVLPGCEHVCSSKCGECIKLSLKAGRQEALVEEYAAYRLARGLPERPGLLGQLMAAGTTWLRQLRGEGAQEEAPTYLAWLRERLSRSTVHAKCAKPCKRTIACGHECTATCHGSGSCPGLCKRPCWVACEHGACSKKCSEPCIPCASACGWSCEHRGRCNVPCSAPCDRLPCDQPCPKTLPCGHRCPGLCGEACPGSNYCVHSDCMAMAPDSLKNKRVDMVMLQDFSDLTPESVTQDPLLVLSCGHAFTMSTLDGHMEIDLYYTKGPEGEWLLPKEAPSELQTPKTCLECRRPITGIRRYGRVIHTAIMDLTDRKHMHSCNLQLGCVHRSQELLKAQAGPGGNLQKALDGGLKLLREGKTMLAADSSTAVFSVLTECEQLMQQLNGIEGSLITPPKLRVYEAMQSRLQRLQEEQRHQAQDAASSAAETEPAQAGASGLTAAQAAALSAARDAAAVLKPDTSQLASARVGMIQVACYALQSITQGLQYADQILAHLNAKANIAQRGGGPRRLSAEDRTAQTHVREHAAWLYTYASQVYGGYAVNPEAITAWMGAALEGMCYKHYGEMGLAAARLALQYVQVLDVLRNQLLTARACRVRQEEAKATQLEVLEQVDEQLGQHLRTLQLHASASTKDQQEALQQLLAQVAQVRRQVQEGADIAELHSVLAALSANEGYGDLMSFLTGHLYRCPNRHVYVIGECGRAMQQSRCPTCGAAVGGGSHHLRPDNAHATDVVEALRAHAHGARPGA